MPPISETVVRCPRKCAIFIRFPVSDQLSLKIDVLEQSDGFPVMCVTSLYLWYKSRYWSSKIDHFFDISLMSLIGIFKIQTCFIQSVQFKSIVNESITIRTGYFQVEDIIKQHFF